MRIGHTGLNKTLQLIGKYESGNCEICNVPETVEHVFMLRKKFKRERVLIKRKIEGSGEGLSLDIFCLMLLIIE